MITGSKALRAREELPRPCPSTDFEKL